MARLVFGMNQSLDGIVDHTAFAPGPKLFQHFVDQTAALSGSIYGRRMYEIMSYFDEERDDWGAPEQAFAQAWRRQPKWVVSRSLQSVGPNATLISSNVEASIARIKADLEGDIDVAGPALAHSLRDSGLIDEYRIYLHPYVVGGGTPFFMGARSPLRLSSCQQMDEGVVRLAYVPA